MATAGGSGADRRRRESETMADERETYRGLVEDLVASHRAVGERVSIYGQAADAILHLCGEIERQKAKRRSEALRSPTGESRATAVPDDDDIKAEVERLGRRVAELESRAEREDSYRFEQNERG